MDQVEVDKQLAIVEIAGDLLPYIKFDREATQLVTVEGVGRAIVFKAKQGEKVHLDPKMLDSHYSGNPENPVDFDYYVVFDDELKANIENTRTHVENDEYLGTQWAEKPRGLHLSPESPTFEQNLEDLTVLANTPGAYEDPSLQHDYAKTAAKLAQEVAQKLPDRRFDHMIMVLRAGEAIGSQIRSTLSGPVYDSMDNVSKVVAKRMKLDETLFKEKRLTFGYNDDLKKTLSSSSLLEDKRLIYAEGCVASGGTVLGLEMILRANGIKTKESMLFAPIASQKGAELYLRMGDNTSVATSPELVTQLNDNWYLMLHSEHPRYERVVKRLGFVPENGVQVAGDFGDLTNMIRKLGIVF